MLAKRRISGAVLVFLMLVAGNRAARAITIQGVSDREVYTDRVSLQVRSEAGFDTTAELNGDPVPLDAAVVVDAADYYELSVRAVPQGGGAAETETVRFIVKDSERKNSEWGLPPWVPYAPVDSAAEEFTGAHLVIVTPPGYPKGLEIPVVALVEDAGGERVGVNGVIGAADLEGLSVRLLRGVGSGFLPPASAAGPLTYTAAVKTLQESVTTDIEATTEWQEVQGAINASTDWGEDARVFITADLDVASGVTLTLGAGSVVKAAPGVDFTVHGKIVVTGSRERPVVFTAGDRSDPWGGFVLRGAVAEITGAIMTGSGADSDWFGNNSGSGHSHRHEQCQLYVGSGSNVTLTDCYLIDNVGQGGHGEDATISMNRCLIQKCISAGQYNSCTVHFDRSAFIEFPAYDAPFADDDNDAIYFTGGEPHITNCLVGWALDDAIDAGSGSGGTVEVSNCWIESCFHEGMAWSGGSDGNRRRPTVRDTVVLNSGQGIESGWDYPDVDAQRILCAANAVGARFGDNYDWSYRGSLNVTDSLLLYNLRNIWGRNWEDWNERLSQMDLKDNFLSESDPNHPDNAVWNPEADASRLLPFLPTPEGPVGVGWGVFGGSFDPAGLRWGVPVCLSTFTTSVVSVDYEVRAAGAAVASGTLQFQPGETVKTISLDDLGVAGFLEFELSQPVNAELAAPATVVATQSVEVIARGSDWKYLDDGTDQGTAWRAVGFDDSSWKSGPAELGYGDGDEATVIEGGPSGARRPTAYFRKEITAGGPGAFESLTLKLRRDDGAVVYVNGVEVFRSNMPSGTIRYSTWASGTVSDEDAFVSRDIDPGLLQAGTNVVAVEVHQANATSSDLSFDLELAGFPAAPIAGGFVRGDANGDLEVDISDAVRILLFLFSGASSDCDDAFDADDSGVVDITDAVYLLGYLFLDGPAVPPPYPSFGSDPVEDDLDCQRG